MSGLVTVTCGACGADFGIVERRYTELRETGETFYCPNGHPRHYTVGKTEDEKTIERLRGQLRDAWDRVGDAVQAERDAMAEMRRCPICREATSRARTFETIHARLVEHLTWEHGAKPRLRAIEAKTGEAR